MNRSPFDELSISQICEQAGVSVGNFYNRFKDKQSLLEALYVAHEKKRTETVELRLDPAAWEGLDLAARVRLMVDAFVDYYSDRPGLIRSFTLHHRSHPGQVPRETLEALTGIYERAASLLAGDGVGITHSDPVGGCKFAIFILAAACREKIVFSSDPQALFVKAHEVGLMTELNRLVLGYLRSGGGSSDGVGA